jgi:hypothetical protein
MTGYFIAKGPSHQLLATGIAHGQLSATKDEEQALINRLTDSIC